MSTAMEMYLSDSVSLQEMLDIDIKSEIDILVGGHNDLSGFNFSDLPPLDLETSNEVRWLPSHNSISGFNLDFDCEDGSTMVNPNTVMPLSLAQNIRSPSPQLTKSHLTFSPDIIKVSSVKSDATTFKKNLLNKMVTTSTTTITSEDNNSYNNKKNEIRMMPKITPIIAKPIIKTVNKNNTMFAFKNTHSLISPVISSFRTINNHNRKQQFNSRMCDIKNEQQYPKPAYSYSCLIAMALKNSVTGSLPVSEIYSFMCRHFPYFKTAPNGWKNSVRHNLSLNKCFEKIEKPAINGAQRKGCLWAMNPAKVVKMDEEVQKWSKKDPIGIRKAMVSPENLESLERGELKFTYEEADTFGDSCGSAESEEGSDNELEAETEIEQTFNGDSNFFGVHVLKTEDDIDIEETDTLYEEMDVEDDKEVLRVELALTQKELFHYQHLNSNKKRKFYLLKE